jgi:zinc transporter, ZIP family
VGAALFWGLVAGSSLVLGGALALWFRIGPRAIGLIMAFGAGVLISAVAYELVLQATETSLGKGGPALGFAAGALAFFFGDYAIDRLGGDDRKRSSGRQASGSGLAIVLGIVLDGIPESVVIGLSLLEGEGVGVAVITAVFLSNLPEAIAATAGLTASGWTRGRVLGLWVLIMIVTALASLAGYVFFDDASANTIAFILAFAAGAILVMLADTMIPEAFEHGGKLVGLATALGFALAFGLSLVE